MGRKPIVLENPPIRIAVTGPESTGKTSLSLELARHYKTYYVREVARSYVQCLTHDLNLFDLVVIGTKQLHYERRIELKSKKYMFCDTELTVLKIWALDKFKKCPPFISEKIDEVKYDLYLLCDIDLPWKYDPYREHPNAREYFFDKYLQEMKDRNLPYAIISGKGKARLQNAIKAIEALGK